MATEATVTIKVSPTEFDLIRDALEFAKKACVDTLGDVQVEAKVRAANRERAGLYSDLIRRLA